MFVHMILSESLNLLLPNVAWWILHYEPDCLQKRLICYLQGQGQSEGYIIKVGLSNMSSELLILLQLNFGLTVHHHRLDCLVKGLDCSLVVKVKVRGKVQNSECSSAQYLNCQTFCNQT